MEQREYRTYLQKPDPLFDTMLTCRDKCIFATTKQKLDRKKQLLMALHELTYFIDRDDEKKQEEFDLYSWATHQCYEIVIVDGTYDEKIMTMHDLLARGIEVYIGTAHPHLPFSFRYNPNIANSKFEKPNHVFSILEETENEYIYFDAKAYMSDNYLPYEKNQQLGIISKGIIEKELQVVFELSYLKWNSENENRLTIYPDEIMRRYIQSYDMPERTEGKNKRLFGRKALVRLKETCISSEYNLQESSKEYSYIPEWEILSWKMGDIGSRRQLFEWWAKENQYTELCDSFCLSKAAWKNLSNAVVYEGVKGTEHLDSHYGNLFDDIYEAESRLYEQILQHVKQQTLKGISWEICT